ncbi:MAG: dienelactone hydrolase family protein [Chloroflexota bacterium]|nr:dienelactone hydrolase family protein [Chloroflexota bacterium]
MTHTEGYFALPASGQGSPVLVLHPWWGLNDTIRAFCRQLAAAGFVAFAPDLYHGKVADTIPDAEILRDALDENHSRASAEVADAAAFLRQSAGSNDQGLAVIGFSLGAYFALQLSLTQPDHVRSVVVFYGTGPGDYSQSKARYLGHFAETDEYEPQAEVERLETSLKQAGRPVTFYQYPDAGHWFFESDRTQAYHPTAAALAWERTLAFLRGDHE